MRKSLLGALGVALVASLLALLPAGSASAAATYDARAGLIHSRSCDAKTGITKQTLVLDNSRSNRRVQYRILRSGDAYHDYKVYNWVAALKKERVTVNVPEGKTVKVVVRVSEQGNKIVRSTSVKALAGCYKPVIAPTASLGEVGCAAENTLVTISLDNTKTTDAAVKYGVTIGALSGAVTVGPKAVQTISASGVNGGPVPVTITYGTKVLLNTSVPAEAC